MNMVFIETPPPIYEVAQLKVNGAVQVYALMFESSFKDKQYDKAGRAKGLGWKDLRDTGGRSEWSVKGLSDCLRLGKTTVLKAIDALLDHGFIDQVVHRKDLKDKLSQIISLLLKRVA